MNKPDVFNLGKEAGYSIAQINAIELLDFTNWTNSEVNEFVENCHEAETNSHEFFPFESLAHNINSCWNSEGLWESYDKGISAGINQYVKEFRKEYRLEEAQEIKIWKVVTKTEEGKFFSFLKSCGVRAAHDLGLILQYKIGEKTTYEIGPGMAFSGKYSAKSFIFREDADPDEISILVGTGKISRKFRNFIFGVSYLRNYTRDDLKKIFLGEVEVPHDDLRNTPIATTFLDWFIPEKEVRLYTSEEEDD